MKVIFIQNVPKIGKIDDIKEVSEGYARNFLFAKNLAVPATPQMLAEIQTRKSKKLKNAEEALQEEQAVAARLDGLEITLAEKTNASGALYAAVTPQKIVDSLKKSGFVIDKNQIQLKAIKQTGQHTAKIRFSYGLEAEISIIIKAAN